jgi:hypothetical protein
MVMSCLDDGQVQAAADGEAAADALQHAASCPRCAERILAARDATNTLLEAIRPAAGMPDRVAHRIGAALRPHQTAGATRLRVGVDRQRRWRTQLWGGAAVTAATVAVLMFAPLLRESDTLSAAEILARSQTRLAGAASGVEVLEYQLVVQGAPQELMPDHGNGTYRIWQAIDHDRPGRFRFASFGPDGQPISSIAQDPAGATRVMFLSVDGQAYRFETGLPAAPGMSLPELERLHMEASIAMMQASGHPMLEIVDAPAGRQYRIDVQQPGGRPVSAVWDLTSVRVLIDATDYRISELEASGIFLRQPYSLSYKLIARSLHAGAPPDFFDVPHQAGEIVLAGEGSALPARDAIVLALRAVGRASRAQ